MDLFDLSGRTAALIGAGGALGSAIAKGLAAAGAAVAIGDLRRDAALAAAADIAAAGGRAVGLECNALDRASITAFHDGIVATLGPPTILLNACGGNNPRVTVTDEKPFEDIGLDDWRFGIDLNLVGGAFLPCQVFGPAMIRAGGGSIINIASVSAHIPLSRVVAYSAAKAGVISLTRFLAREWATRGVRVNSITPGFFPAEQNRALLFNPDGSPTARGRMILEHTGMKRLGRPEELVGAVIFLASDRASSFVTGADLRIDGGFLSQTI
jgi:NAD(P)-dependent dehydrogenase (short-subunit alcohol dehydrogenase family)